MPEEEGTIEKGVDIKEMGQTDRLNFDDMLWISRQSLGLRHLPNREQAVGESQNGVDGGDALALSSFGGLLETVDFSGVDEQKAIMLRNLPLEYSVQYLSDDGKAMMMERYNEILRNHLEICAGWDVNECCSEGMKVNEVTRAVIDRGMGFVVGKFQGADSGDDKDGYGGLGKCGKQKVEPDEMKGLITIEEDDLKDSELRTDESEMNEASFNKMKSVLGEVTFAKFVKLIKRLEERG